jgi:hypothetical protein
MEASQFSISRLACQGEVRSDPYFAVRSFGPASSVDYAVAVFVLLFAPNDLFLWTGLPRRSSERDLCCN